MHAAMLLLGLGIILVSCGGNSSSRGGSNSSDNYSSSSQSKKGTTFSYKSDVMSYLKNHKFVSSSGDCIKFTNSSIVGSSVINVTNFEVVNWDSETAIVRATTIYNTSLTIYVYASEGYIVDSDGDMFFAK